MRVGEAQGALMSNLLPGKFGKLWVERTVQLKPAFEDSPKSPVMIKGSGGGSGSFPLLAYATLIDSSLVEYGLKEFEKLSEMPEEEVINYETTYQQMYKTDRYHFIWLELQTPYTEEILDLNRWNIWLEDNKGNKYDPAEIIELSAEKKQNTINSENRNPISKNIYQWKISAKTILLFFPKKDINGKKVIDKSTQTITLVLFDWNNKSVKNKGTWNLQSLM